MNRAVLIWGFAGGSGAKLLAAGAFALRSKGIRVVGSATV